MCFASREDEIGPVRQRVQEAGHAAGVECHLVGEAARGIRSKLGHRAAKALRVLFGEQDRHPKQLRRIDKASRVGCDRRAIVDRRHEPRLKIDNQQSRGLTIYGGHAVAVLP
jgi:hypothetical protein